jgi:hypothetical protein
MANGKVATFKLWLVGIGFAVGVFQLVLLIWQSSSTAKAANAAKSAADASILAQRPYVSLSHLPPGLLFGGEEADEHRPMVVKIRVKNEGKTPADVTTVVLTAAFSGVMVFNHSAASWNPHLLTAIFKSIAPRPLA